MSQEREAGPVSLWFRRALGWGLLAPYLRLVRATSQVIHEPFDLWQQMQSDWPVLVTSWHGQSYLVYSTFFAPARLAIMTSNHADGQIAVGIAQSFGFGVIAGSGASERQRHGTGGLAAFRQTLRELATGRSAFATADIPPIPGRHVSRGLIAIARHSGRPIFTMGFASSGRHVFDKAWDKMHFHLPFSRIALVADGPFHAGPEAEEEADAARLHESLDKVHSRAMAIADGKS